MINGASSSGVQFGQIVKPDGKTANDCETVLIYAIKDAPVEIPMHQEFRQGYEVNAD